MNDRRLLAYAVLGIGVLAVSWAAVLVREADAPALVIASYRLGLAALPVGALAVWQQRRVPEAITRATVWPLLLSAAFLAAHFAFWITSLQHTSVVTAVVLMAVQPLFVAIASPLLLHEPVDRRVWLALAIASIGTAVMAAEDFGEGLGTLAGDLFALLGGVFAACYIIVGRWARPSTSWVRYVGVVYPVTALLLFATTLIAQEPLTGYSTKTYVMIALMALGPQLIGHGSINWALGYLPAVIVALAILVEPVGATALAAIILDETPTGPEIAGALLVLFGVYIGLRPERAETLALEAEVTAEAGAD
jgi:drug/metabolite transporter (DMT)-like permease